MQSKPFTESAYRDSLRRAGLARAVLFAHVVDGKSYTTAQIARRLGITTDAALGRAKRGPFPLTWDALASKRRKAA